MKLVSIATIYVVGVGALHVPAYAHTRCLADVTMSALPPPGFEWGYSDVQECLVDAENAAEQAACLGETPPVDAVAPVAREPTKGDDDGTVLAANGRDMMLGFHAQSIDECLVEAENASEIAECQSDYDDLVSGD